MIATVDLARVNAGENDRQAFPEDSLRELADSIAAYGLAQPPTVRRVGERFEIVAGERRIRAVRMLGWDTVPAFVREMDDATASAVMLAENVQRADLDPMEEARAYRSRMERFGYSAAEVARVANVSPDRVRKRLSLLALEDGIAHLVSRKQLPLAFAYCMTALDSNRQHLALRAYQSSPLTLEQFRALTSRLFTEQQQESMFDPATFMQVEAYVEDACQAVEASSTIDEMDADPVGVKDIADRLGVKQQTVSMWRFRGLLPEPRWTVSDMPVWQWSDIKKWAKSTGRL